MKAINDFFNNRKVRKIFLKLRYPLFIILLLLLFTQLKARWFVPGLLVSILGELLQVWCFSTIKTHKEVTRVGPYMLMRNPMYIGRFFLIFGILMMTGSIWILAGFTLLYYFYMTNRVSREEGHLQALFGAEYENYCRSVNRYVPGFKNVVPDKLAALSRESFFQNNAHLNLLLVAVCYVVLYVMTFIWPIG